MALQIIHSISYTPINGIVSYSHLPFGKVKIEVNSWKPFPMHPASGDLDTSTRSDAPGTVYNSTVSARLKNDIQLPPSAIIRITLCSGKELILGTPDLPVRVNKNLSLHLSTLSISYSSYQQPLELISD